MENDMPTCLECGFSSSRLQWTHFKYNCTGRFKNGTEYKKVYPNALLVDPELAKRTGVTKDNLISKYGELEGTKRWNEYRNKQSESNSFEYKAQKHGWTKEDFDAFNLSRGGSLENYIKKHGESKGIRLWEEYCEKQRYTTTIEYFISEYGESEGKAKYEAMNKAKGKSMSKRDVSPVSKLEEEIVEEIVKRIGKELDYSCRTKQYCVSKKDRVYFYDIVHNNRSIEINGDYWHCNPSIYPSNYYQKRMDMLAEDIWTKDSDKQKLIMETRNIPLLVIWEKDYRENPEQEIERAIAWILEDKQ